jgi:hypothetical protein
LTTIEAKVKYLPMAKLKYTRHYVLVQDIDVRIKAAKATFEDSLNDISDGKRKEWANFSKKYDEAQTEKAKFDLLKEFETKHGIKDMAVKYEIYSNLIARYNWLVELGRVPFVFRRWP